MQLASLTTVTGPNVPRQHMMPRSRAVLGVVAGGEVGDLAAGEEEGAEVAQVLPAAGARRAAAARRDEAEGDVVADGERGDAGADLDDARRRPRGRR